MGDLPSAVDGLPAIQGLSLVAEPETGERSEKSHTEQQIDPWSVTAAVDEQGRSLAFDYEAISR